MRTPPHYKGWRSRAPLATATPAGTATEEMRSSSPSKPPFSDEHVRAPLLFEGQFVFDRLFESAVELPQMALSNFE